MTDASETDDGRGAQHVRAVPAEARGAGIRPVRDALAHLRGRMAAAAHLVDGDTALAPEERASAENLLAYLTLRREDVRPLQRELAALGLSSLGRSEAHALATVERVLGLLELQLERNREVVVGHLDEAERRLAHRATRLLGPSPEHRDTRIMVTLPSAAASDPGLVVELARAGMDVARLNCAHDDLDGWQRMAANVRAAARQVARPLPLLADLPGPKLRTGGVEPAPAVLHVRPPRDDLGRALRPARVWLAPPGAPPHADADFSVPVPPRWLAALASGEAVELTDTRGRHRVMLVGNGDRGGRWAALGRSAFIVEGTILEAEHAGLANVGVLPTRPGGIRLQAGDELVLTRDQRPGSAARDDEPARIPCTLPEAFGAVRPGHAVWLDDGRFGGSVRAADRDQIRVVIEHAPTGGGRLREGKGINLPDTDLPSSALPPDHGAMLDFAAAEADIVGLSFVSSADDVRAATEALDARGARSIGLVLKIETRRAFEQLPALLLAGLRSRRPCGVMIARGDLAVEVGWQRLAEVQEEVLWLCEAAHLPSIWATQVLDDLARTGLPARAEITDAAMGARAECVMLNKGPHIVDAVRALDDILARMRSHQRKKTSLLRRLNAWDPASLAPDGREGA